MSRFAFPDLRRAFRDGESFGDGTIPSVVLGYLILAGITGAAAGLASLWSGSFRAAQKELPESKRLQMLVCAWALCAPATALWGVVAWGRRRKLTPKAFQASLWRTVLPSCLVVAAVTAACGMAVGLVLGPDGFLPADLLSWGMGVMFLFFWPSLAPLKRTDGSSAETDRGGR